MKKLKLFHDKKGNTLTVWFDTPTKEVISEEIGGDFVVMKDKQGKVIGFEKLNYVLENSKQIPLEIISS